MNMAKGAAGIDNGMGLSVYRGQWGIYICLVILHLSILGGGCANPNGLEISYYYTQTEDEVTLALKRFKPEVVAADTDPVILCHGFSYNMLFWDLAEEVSLPRYLAKEGYDVWLLSLRGSAPSSQPFVSAMRKLTHFHLEPEMLNMIRNRLGDRAMLDWSVDDHIRYDVPTAISYVREQTGHEQVHWVGHSMGAMNMFGYLGYEPGEKAQEINSFVAIAAPMVVFHPLSDPLSFLLEQEKLLAVGSKIIGSSAPATFGTIFGN
ncbi:MAG: alpha/beta hydrolase, partial [Planctomycetes bacterium]|nr:alpha/beta hydrolase [Planctomycetota bacterium]